jgi:hypothetical protein
MTTTPDDKKVPGWRVTFWYLDGFGWTQLGFAFVEAKSEQLALMVCTQRASKLGFHVDQDTKVEIRPETGDGRL